MGPTPLSDLGPYMKSLEAVQCLSDGSWVLQANLSKAQRLLERMEWEGLVFLSLFRCQILCIMLFLIVLGSAITKTLYNICRQGNK